MTHGHNRLLIRVDYDFSQEIANIGDFCTGESMMDENMCWTEAANNWLEPLQDARQAFIEEFTRRVTEGLRSELRDGIVEFDFFETPGMATEMAVYRADDLDEEVVADDPLLGALAERARAAYDTHVEAWTDAAGEAATSAFRLAAERE